MQYEGMPDPVDAYFKKIVKNLMNIFSVLVYIFII